MLKLAYPSVQADWFIDSLVMKGIIMAFPNIRRVALGGAAFCMLASSFAGMASANASSGDTMNIVRSNERGQVSAHGVVRSVHVGAVNPGMVSAGAPIVLSYGNATSLPCLNTDGWNTRGQPYRTFGDCW